MSLQFDQPALLLVACLIVPVVAAGWWALRAVDRLRRVTVLAARALLLGALAVALAGPRMVREHDQLTVIGVLDLSGSVRRFAEFPPPPQPEAGDAALRTTVGALRDWFRRATSTRAADDRFGLIVFDGQASVISVPVEGPYVDDNIDVSVVPGTNIATALDLALAMFPADTARRIVLVSDGNETAGSALEAARQAAAGGSAGVPIDVVPIVYAVTGDVQMVRLEAPPQAEAGQTVTVRMVVEATAPTSGRLILEREGVAVDLNGSATGTARQVALPEGRSVHLAQVALGDTPINRFEAVFEPDDPATDRLPENDRAGAFTATPSRGEVLVIDPEASRRENPIAAALQEAGIPVEVRAPEGLDRDLLSLQAHDLIVLDNVPASAFDLAGQVLLARWVNDFGGGLIMIGGESGFGAGGWNGTPVEEILPLELDPPKELRLARAALVLVLDKSGSMNEPVAGTRTTQQVIANEAAAMAVESLRAESLVGVVTFDFVSHEVVPLQPNTDPKAIAAEIRGITAEGGTNMKPALRRAYTMLANVEAKRKLVVCLSDGRSESTDMDEIVDAMVAKEIKVTTIAIGDEADEQTLRRVAERGGGEFYHVQNPRTLPRVLVDSVQVINRPLLKEVPFKPVVLPTGSTLTAGMDEAPILDGLVITTPRNDPQVVVELKHPEGDPLLAHWQVGLGRVAAFTSDADGRWSSRWLEWPGSPAFWTQLARTISRPATSPDTELVASIEDDRLNVSLEAAGDESALLEDLSVDGTVYAPDGTTRAIKLRQTAPGRYEASVPAQQAGNYIVALSPRKGGRRLAPVVGGASQPHSVEYRRFESNEPLLDAVAALTGGRKFDVADQAPGPKLFDHEGLATSRSALPIWTAVLWAALALLLADVATRRIAWDAALIRRAALRAAARTMPAEARVGRSMATLASRRRGGPAETQPPLPTEAAPAPEAPSRVERPRTKPAPAPAPGALRHPDPQKVSAALDVLLGRGVTTSTDQAPSSPAAPPRPDTAPAAPEEPARTTRDLLEARRRARKRLER